MHKPRVNNIASGHRDSKLHDIEISFLSQFFLSNQIWNEKQKYHHKIQRRILICLKINYKKNYLEAADERRAARATTRRRQNFPVGLTATAKEYLWSRPLFLDIIWLLSRNSICYFERTIVMQPVFNAVLKFLSRNMSPLLMNNDLHKSQEVTCKKRHEKCTWSDETVWWSVVISNFPFIYNF